MKRLTIPALIEQQAALRPNHIAVKFGKQALTYAQLNSQANQLAHSLQQHYDIQPDSLIPLMLDRNLMMIVTILSVLKCGAAYIPVSNAWPAQRINYLFADCKARFAITHQTYSESLAALENKPSLLILEQLNYQLMPTHNLSLAIADNQLVYAIYTSGSTGQPKGVLIEHRNLMALFEDINQHLQLNMQDNFLALTTYTFDISVLELLLPLTLGACCVIAESNLMHDPEQFSLALRQFAISITQATPSLWQLMLTNGCRLPAHLKVLCGGEKLSSRVAALLLAQLPQFWNVYGPTETTIWSTIALLTRSMPLDSISMGKPLAQTKVWVLNEQKQLAGPFEEGELSISGMGVARGYLNNTALTQQRFITASFAPGEKLYNTGDRVRILADGDLEYISRVDDQVKVNGFRIEMAEIEQQLQAFSGIAQAAVFVDERDDIKQLQACIVPMASNTVELTHLHSFLAERLPGHMIPQCYFLVEQIPLTSHGKVDRKQLAQDSLNAPMLGNAYMAPHTVMQQQLRDIWAEVLRIDKQSIGIHDNFFLCGGHSLHAAQVLARISKICLVKLNLADLFYNPTITQLAEVLSKQEIFQTPIPITISDRDNFELSFAQQGLWFVNQLDRQAKVYNIPVALHIQGALNIAALDSAITKVRQRHAILRTCFIRKKAALYQYVQPAHEIQPLLQQIDLEDKQDFINQAEIALKQPFQLEQAPLMRAHLYCCGNHEYFLLISMHHLICDEWSIHLLKKELAHFYQYPELLLPVLPLQYGDFSAWQRQVLSTDYLKKQLNYWQQQLAELPILELACDYSRPSKQYFDGQQIIFQIPSMLRQQLQALAQKTHVSLFTVMLTAFAILCARYSNQQDFAIGTPVAGRNRLEFEALIGLFINTLVLRINLAEEPDSLTLLKRNQQCLFEAFDHQDIPLEKLVEAINPIRDPAYSPLFQVMLVMQNIPQQQWQLGTTQITPLILDSGSSQYDLTLLFNENEQGLQGKFVFNTQLFKPETIARMSRHLLTLLQDMMTYPTKPIGLLQLLGADELLFFSHQPVYIPPNLTLIQLFEQQEALYPDNLALLYDDSSLTYTQLNERANCLAYYLRHQYQVSRNTLVPIWIARSQAMIIAVLAVLKAGGAYVPLDARYPVDRIKEIIKDTQAQLLVSQSSLIAQLAEVAVHKIDMENLPELAKQANLVAINTPDDLAYVIYTSGSTGKPKGALIHHAGVVNTITAQIKAFQINAKSRILQFASFGFDSSVSETFRALLSGATLVLSHPDSIIPGETLADTLEKQGITVLTQPPAALALLPPRVASTLQTLITAGEACPVALMQQWAEKVLFINAYGPTEASICATIAVGHSEDTKLPIGKPLPNVTVYVLDAHRQFVPVNVWGELYIGGAGVGKGYLNRPELTAELFVDDPFSATGGKMYKTGDRVRWLDEESLEYGGRYDEQIKLRGFRIEPNEIAIQIKQFPSIREAVVLPQLVDNDKRLAAFIVTTQTNLLISELRSFLQEKLPYYMIPDRFFVVDHIPLTANRKIDRNRLLQEASQVVAIPAIDLPSTNIEKSVAQLFEKLLDTENIGVNDNFFAVGGHSLLLIHLAMAIESAFKQKFAIPQLLAQPTVAAIAKMIAKQNNQDVNPIIPLNTKATGTPIYLIHETSGLVSYYERLAEYLGAVHPVYAIQDPTMDSEASFNSIETMAGFYVAELKKYQPQGPYILSGWCMGGIVAYEMAQQLMTEQHKVSVILLDTPADSASNLGKKSRQDEFAEIKKAFIALQKLTDDYNEEFVNRRVNEILHRIHLMRLYKPQHFDGMLTLIKANLSSPDMPLVDSKQWECLTENSQFYTVPETHHSLLKEPGVQNIAQLMSDTIK